MNCNVFRVKKELKQLTLVWHMLVCERESFHSKVSFSSFQARYSFHIKFGSVNYFVFSLFR